MNLWRMNLVILKNRHRKLHQTIIVMTGMMRITKIKSKTLMMKSQTLIKSFMIGGKKNKNLRINKKAGSQSKKMTQLKKNLKVMWIPNRKKKKSLQPSFRDWVTFFLWDAVDQANVDYNFNNVCMSKNLLAASYYQDHSYSSASGVSCDLSSAWLTLSWFNWIYLSWQGANAWLLKLFWISFVRGHLPRSDLRCGYGLEKELVLFYYWRRKVCWFGLKIYVLNYLGMMLGFDAEYFAMFHTLYYTYCFYFNYK